jgi:small subunit ribosomal protein S15
LAIDAAEKKELIQQYQIHQQDTGSPETQVAILNARIQQLTEHFRTHRKDHHSRYGLYRLVGKQRRLLQYLYKKDVTRYYRLINELGMRDTIGTRSG